MTQQEMDTILAEIETRFPGLEVNGKMEMQADYKNKTFTEEGTIAVWSEGHCISVLHSRKAFDAFINVARIMSQGQLYSKADEYAAQFYGTPGAELFTERVVKYVELLCEEKRYNEADEVISQHGLDPNLNPTYATRMLMEVDN